MDRDTFNSIASTTLQEFTKKIDSADREDFVQDMWVNLLHRDAFGSFLATTTTEARPAQARSYLYLILFRMSETWHQKNAVCRRARPVDPSELLEIAASMPREVCSERQGTDKLHAHLRAKVGAEQADIIILGLRKGTPKAQLAQSIQISPQLFNVWLRKAA